MSESTDADADGDGEAEADGGVDPVAGAGVAGADDEARHLLETLVSIPSPSGEESECAEALADFFRERDREVWLDEVGNVRAPADDRVLLTSHVDTVPGDIPVRIEQREEPEKPEEREATGTAEVPEAEGDDAEEDGDDAEVDEDDAEDDGSEDGPVLWGRGSVDAKGPLAAMAVAAVREGVSFVGVVGEERTSRGARHLIDDREAPEAVVNGEPSGWDGVTLGYRGILQGTYVATSESGHTSRPENNAIQDAIAWWSHVENEFERDPYDPTFEQVTPKPVRVEGGTSADGLSVEATLDVQLRVPPSRTAEEVREVADGYLDGGTVNWHDAVPPVMASPRTPVARAFRAAIREQGGEPRLLRKTGTSDMNLYAEAWDCPMATYGPGDSDLDHAPDERLPLPELDRAVAVLQEVCQRL